MKRPYFYVIAWRPKGKLGEQTDLKFRHKLVFALSEDAAYSKGHEWAEREKILPLDGPGNDYVIGAEGDDPQVKLVMRARAEA